MKAARFRVGACLIIALVAVVAGGVPQAGAFGTGLVISQVYGGGGNAGASHTHDFVELYNPSGSAVTLTGLSIQYASATGAGLFGSSSTQGTELSGTIQPQGYFLVQEATNNATVGVPLPAPDHVDATPIAMAAGAGKVVLATGTGSLGCNGGSVPCDAAAQARIVDLVGYGGADFFEGSGPTPALTSATSAQRKAGGCQDTNDNAADFTAAATAPRNSSNSHVCDADQAPSVSSTSPAAGASDVAPASDITITFSEAVSAAGDWYSISCGTTGAHAATVSGGPVTYTLDPAVDFGLNETCTVTVHAVGVSDVDADDPPDQMAADHTFSFTTELPLTQIAQVQGATHTSPYAGQLVKVEGVVIAERGSSVWIQDSTPDASPATSEAVLVFGSSVASAVAVGDSVHVRGTVQEFRPGCPCAPTSSAFDNLTITELASPGLGVTNFGPAPPPPATVIGAGGRVPPTEVIEDDAQPSGNVETDNTFDPEQDGIDFYETLESMLVQVNNPVVVGPTNDFGELLVLADDGAGAGIRTARGGIVVRAGDFNPERVMLDDAFMAVPDVDVADHFTTSAVGVMTYEFANFKIGITRALTESDGGLAREVTVAQHVNELAVATFNVENLAPGDPAAKFQRLAGLIVDNLQAPDLIAIEEIQDNDGATNSSVVDASVTWGMLIAAIEAAGGPHYDFREIDPVDDQDGGQPGGNIRVGFLFRTDRGLSFVDRPGGNATTPTGVFREDGRAHLTLSPGRVDPLNPAWEATRKPLAGEFTWFDKTVIVVANHFSSKGGDDPLFGRFQPPVQSSAPKRHQQAASVNDFGTQILALERKANFVVLGDINDFEFSETTQILESDGVMSSLMHVLPQAERYSYVFEGNSQVLDQILFSANMLRGLVAYDVVHVNAEYSDQASDHDPSVARVRVLGGGGGESD